MVMGESTGNISTESGNIISEDLVNIYKELTEIIITQGDFIIDDQNHQLFRIVLDAHAMLFKQFLEDGWKTILLEYQDDRLICDTNQSLSILPPKLKAVFCREEQVTEYSSVEYQKSFYFNKDIDTNELNSRVEAINGLPESEYMRLNLGDIKSFFIREQILAEESHYHNDYNQPKTIHQSDIDLLKKLIELYN